MYYLYQQSREHIKKIKKKKESIPYTNQKWEEDMPLLNKRIVLRIGSVFFEQVGKSVMHVLTEAFIGVFHIRR